MAKDGQRRREYHGWPICHIGAKSRAREEARLSLGRIEF